MVPLSMPHADRKRWQAARSLGDVAEFTAQWLEGRIGSQPGYMPGCGPAPETAALVPVLAGLCRAGYLTIGSQPGEADDGDGWEQRAAVEGFASAGLAARIRRAAGDAGLIVIARDPAGLPRWRNRRRGTVTVTRDGGWAHTHFGTHLSRAHIADWHVGWGMCHRDAVDALCGAHQVTVADPVWGRPDALWRVLAASVLAPAGGRS